MSLPGYQIRGVTLDDASTLANNNMSAFWEDPNWVILWKSITLPYLISQVTLRMPRNLLRDRDILRHETAVDPVTGSAVGYARWKLPAEYLKTGAGTPAWPTAQIAEITDAEELAKIEAAANQAWWQPGDAAPDDVVSGKCAALQARKPHLLLDYLAVHPESKGKGIATALVKSGMRKAEEMGIPICMLAFKAGKGVYEKLGFKVIDSVIQDDSKWGGPGEYAVYLMAWDKDRTD